MKKRICIIIVAVLFLVFSACGRKGGTQEVHKRDDVILRQFDMISYERDYGKVCIETKDYTKAEKIMKLLDENSIHIDFKTNDFQPQTLYFLTKEPESILPLWRSNYIYIPLEGELEESVQYAIQEVIYREFNCSYWVAYGLSHLSRKIDENLCDILENPQFHLNGTDFFDEFQNKEDVILSKDAAVLLTKTSISSKKKVGKSEISMLEEKMECEDEDVQYITGYDSLKYIKVSSLLIQILDPYGSAEKDGVTNSYEMARYLNCLSSDIESIKKYFNEIETLPTKDNIEKIVYCERTNNDSDRSYYDVENNKILFAEWGALQHEYVHTILEDSNIYNYPSLNEGIAQYVGFAKFNRWMSEYYPRIIMNQPDVYGSVAEKLNIDSSTKSVDVEEFFHILTLEYQQDERDKTEKLTMADITGGRERIEAFGSLTYTECADFVAYVINKYSMDKLIMIYTNTNLTESDKMLLELYDEWKENINLEEIIKDSLLEANPKERQ